MSEILNARSDGKKSGCWKRSLLLVPLLVLLACTEVRAEEHTGLLTHDRQVGANSALLTHWALTHDSEIIRERVSTSEGRAYQRPDNYGVCQDILAELNSGSDVRLNLTDFPRAAISKTGLQRIHWRRMSPAQNMGLVIKMLAYRYKNDNTGSTSTTTPDDGMTALLQSGLPEMYKSLIADGSVVLENASFDMDNDHVKDTVFRMGRRITTLEGVSWPRSFAARLGDPGDWQYLVELKRSGGVEVQSGLDIDQGGGGASYRYSPQGVFLYKSMPIFYYLYEDLHVVDYEPDSSQPLKQRDLCGFHLVSGDGQ